MQSEFPSLPVVNKHGLLPLSLLDLPLAMSNPIFVFRSTPDTISVFTELKDDSGKNVFVAIKLDANKQLGHEFLKVNDILTIHGRDVENIVNPIVDNDSLVWVDKEKALEWLSIAPPEGASAETQELLNSAAKVVENFDNPKISDKKNDGVGEKVGELFRDSGVLDRYNPVRRARQIVERLKRLFGGRGDVTMEGVEDYWAVRDMMRERYGIDSIVIDAETSREDLLAAGVREEELGELMKRCKNPKILGCMSPGSKKICIFARNKAKLHEIEHTFFHEAVHKFLHSGRVPYSGMGTFYNKFKNKYPELVKHIERSYKDEHEQREEFFAYNMDRMLFEGDFDLYDLCDSYEKRLIDNILNYLNYDIRKEEVERAGKQLPAFRRFLFGRVRDGHRRLGFVLQGEPRGEGEAERGGGSGLGREPDRPRASEGIYKVGDGRRGTEERIFNRGRVGEESSGLSSGDGLEGGVASGAETDKLGWRDEVGELFRDEPVEETLDMKKEWDKLASSFAFQLRETAVDYLTAVKKMQELIEKKLGQKIKDFENAHAALQQVPRQNKVEMDNFNNFVVPQLKEAMVKLLGKWDGKAKWDEGEFLKLHTYTYAKHGIERNRQMAVEAAVNEYENDDEKARLLEDWEREKAAVLSNGGTWAEQQRQLDNLALTFGADLKKDYSGLTSLFEKEAEDTGESFTEIAYQYVESALSYYSSCELLKKSYLCTVINNHSEKLFHVVVVVNC